MLREEVAAPEYRRLTQDVESTHTQWEGLLRGARVLIVDDEENNIRILERVLERAGCGDLRSTTDPRRAREMFLGFQPDLVMLDLRMPYLDGFGVLRQLGDVTPEGAFVPIVVLTADLAPDAKRRALAEGASDFLTKPFDLHEVLLRTRNLLQTRRLHDRLEEQNRGLEERVRERTRELEEAQIETLDRLALAAEYRDDDTGEHIRRVGRTSALVAAALGVADERVELIERAAALHDVGKIGVPDAILLKPGKLDREEFEQVKRHTSIGAGILRGSRSPFLQLAEAIALAHHERWDGGGYLELRGEDIPLEARITTIADVFDALTHERPYKEAWPVDRAFEEIERQRGRQFDPEVVNAFFRVKSQVVDAAETSTEEKSVA